MKTFSDLVFGKYDHSQQAFIDFENGYGVSIWKMQQHRMDGSPYAGCLNKGEKLRINSKFTELQWVQWLSESDVTDYMRKVQVLKTNEVD